MSVMKKRFMIARILICCALKSKGIFSILSCKSSCSCLPPPYSARPPGLALFEIRRSQTTKGENRLVIRSRVIYLNTFLQVREDLHVYRKMCDTLDKVRPDLNGAVRSVGNGCFPIPLCSARPPGFAFFEIRRSQTTENRPSPYGFAAFLLRVVITRRASLCWISGRCCFFFMPRNARAACSASSAFKNKYPSLS